MIHQLISAQHAEIVTRTRAKSAARAHPNHAAIEHDHAIPIFLYRISAALRLPSPQPGVLDEDASKHGAELRRRGFTVSQVVHCYGDICQAVTELAAELGTPIATDDFRIFSRYLDEAIASAVVEYGARREAAILRTSSERLSALVHQLDGALRMAISSFSILRRQTTAPDSGVEAVLSRSLLRFQHLIGRSLSDVETRSARQERFSLAALIQETAVSAALEATRRGISFSVTLAGAPTEVEADRHQLGIAIENIVHNALKFTRPKGHVSLRVRQLAGEVLIEVEDECGGLPKSEIDRLFQAFEQGAEDRSGLGLGLWISRAGVQAMGGRLCARNVPGKGCVFSIALRG